jgi:hypothetical protein
MRARARARQTAIHREQDERVIGGDWLSTGPGPGQTLRCSGNRARVRAETWDWGG